MKKLDVLQREAMDQRGPHSVYKSLRNPCSRIVYGPAAVQWIKDVVRAVINKESILVAAAVVAAIAGVITAVATLP